MSNIEQNAIAIIPSKMIPKPTKTEVVKALVQLRISELEAARKQSGIRQKKLCQEIEAELLKIAAKINAKESKVSWNVWSNSISYIEVKKTIKESTLPASLVEKIHEQRRELAKSNAGFDPKKIEREIRMKLNNRQESSERVELMLRDKESRKVLSEMLEEISR